MYCILSKLIVQTVYDSLVLDPASNSSAVRSCVALTIYNYIPHNT